MLEKPLNRTSRGSSCQRDYSSWSNWLVHSCVNCFNLNHPEKCLSVGLLRTTWILRIVTAGHTLYCYTFWKLFLCSILPLVMSLKILPCLVSQILGDSGYYKSSSTWSTTSLEVASALVRFKIGSFQVNVASSFALTHSTWGIGHPPYKECSEGAVLELPGGHYDSSFAHTATSASEAQGVNLMGLIGGNRMKQGVGISPNQRPPQVEYLLRGGLQRVIGLC